MITLQEIAPYLPYGLQIKLTCDYTEDYIDCDWADLIKFKEGCIWKLAGYADKDLNIPLGEGDLSGFIFRNESTYTCFSGNGYKFLLRPLSDLTQEIEHNGEKFVPSHVLSNTESTKTGYTWNYYKIDNDNVRILNYEIIEKFFEWHFDVFGLIERGDAIDTNTLFK